MGFSTEVNALNYISSAVINYKGVSGGVVGARPMSAKFKSVIAGLTAV